MDPFIPVFWNWMEKHLVCLMGISNWGFLVLGEVRGALSCLWVIQWDQCSVWVGMGCLLPLPWDPQDVI